MPSNTPLDQEVVGAANTVTHPKPVYARVALIGILCWVVYGSYMFLSGIPYMLGLDWPVLMNVWSVLADGLVVPGLVALPVGLLGAAWRKEFRKGWTAWVRGVGILLVLIIVAGIIFSMYNELISPGRRFYRVI